MIATDNPQNFALSQLADSGVEDTYLNDPDALFNSKRPNLVVMHEKAEHRLIIYLKAQGMSNSEIAKRTGYSDAWVSQVLRQPWARQRLIQELRVAGRDAVQGLLAGAAEDSVLTLIELRDTSGMDAVRKAAADSLLDRFLGKATQRVETKSTSVNINTSLDTINKELAELERQEQELTVGRPAQQTNPNGNNS